MAALMSALAKAQLPVAALLLVVLAYDLVLRHQTGVGLGPDAIMALLAGAAGALGVKRPSEAVER